MSNIDPTKREKTNGLKDISNTNSSSKEHQQPMAKQTDETDVFNILRRSESYHIFFFGKPSAGKSAILASLLWYLNKSETGLFHIENKDEENKASIYTDGLEAGTFPELTPEGGSFHIQGIFTPHNEKIDDLDITFLEVPGEDCRKVEDGQIPKKLSLYFRANVKMIFILVAPFDFKEDINNQGVSSDDQGLMQKFLSYLARENANNINKAPSILLISQVDKYKKRRKMDSEKDLVRKLMPNLCNSLKRKDCLTGCYSIGEVTLINDEPAIRTINKDYPAQVWREIYMLCTGQDLKPKEKKKSLRKRIAYFFTGKNIKEAT